MNTRENFLNAYFATNQVWDEIAKDSNHQTTTAWKLWIIHNLIQNNVLAFFCQDKFSVLPFSNLMFHVAKTLGMRHFCFWTSQHELSKSYWKAQQVQSHVIFCEYDNNCWNSTLNCNWCKSILHLLATEPQMFFFWLNCFDIFWLILANSKP